jgi:cell shape-determining protein MreC
MEIDAQLKTIQAKLQTMLKQYQLLQRENMQLKKELGKSRQQHADTTAHLQVLQQQVDVMKLGVNGWNEDEKADLEKRIDVYLKEIDKCIALLHN